MRRCKGIWPPSKPGRCEYPLRDFWPLLPAPEVFPSFEPMPRPTRTLRWREPRGGFRLDKVTDMLASIPGYENLRSFHDDDEMTHFVYHTTDGRGILALDHLLQAPETEPAHRFAHIPGAADITDHPLQLKRCRLVFGHDRFSGQLRNSSTGLERNSATRASSFRRKSASKVALMTLCGLEVPIDFVRTLEMPATSITARTGPPAMIPVPSGAGFSITWPEPYRPRTWCGIVVPFKFR